MTEAIPGGAADRTKAPEAAACRGWRPTIAGVLISGFGLLVLVAVSAVLLVALGTAQKNTVALLRQTADTAVAGLIDRIDIHLGAARDQTEFLARIVDTGDVDPGDRDQLADAMLGALAAAPQVTGIGFFAQEGWSLRVGRDAGGTLRLFEQAEADPEIRRLVEETTADSGTRWGGVFWVPSLKQPHLAVTTPVIRQGRYIGVVSSVVSVRALSLFVDDYALKTGFHPFILYGRDRVLAHPSLIDGGQSLGLGSEKPLPGLAELGDPQLADIWNDDKKPMELLEDFRGSLLGHWRPLPGDEVYYLYRVIGGYGPRQLYMGIYVLESEIDSSETDRLALAGWIGLAILVLSLLTAVVLGRKIARPVRDLAEAARAVSTFDFRRVPQAKGSAFRELDSAAGAFNAMLSGLRWFETYVPRSLVLRLIQLGEDGVQSEERPVTVIFTDIVGFTAASQKLTPRETADFLNHHFGQLAAEIEATGGTLDKYIGDSVMAFWGAPDDQPDHAERACRAALAIDAVLESDNRARVARGLPPVRLRIGIHSGPAIVGNIGAPGRVNYTLIGDTVNLANRLEAFGKEVAAGAQAAVILISEATRAQLGPAWQVEDLGSHQMRGRAGDIGVFRLRGEG
ncbi:adenylate/guanylate cyclase domain-containing protein [Pelagibius marinus]|uniref:adenylate/guanylate cyclase domain-containing protein n=1 Tax=Pelagibius marinus TaxID=2762760 RepID=UPI00187239B6|nr:adenylate/guanylate cyclase domain-containing protein [Pelagibius marinus]